MGIEVPVAVTTKEGANSFQYRNVGTNIDCRARSLGDGRFKLDLGVEQSSIYRSPEAAASAAGGGGETPDRPVPVESPNGPPLFRTFNAQFAVVLRDGQSSQHTTATDPVSGEVMKIDVGLTVLK